MVDAKVSMVCVLVGIVGLVVGSIAAIAFATSTEFAVGTVSCNPDASPTLATDDNCVENTFVDSNGDVCQIGNLGLFLASFTPECTYGSAYEINQALAPQSNVNTLDFGVLFPAQTNFAGLGEALLFPNFTTCDEYFQDAAIVTGLTGLARNTLNETLDALRTGTKEQYDDGLDSNFADLDSTFQGIAVLINDLLSAVSFPPFTVDLTTTDVTLANTDASAVAIIDTATSGAFAACDATTPGNWTTWLTNCVKPLAPTFADVIDAVVAATEEGLNAANVCGSGGTDLSSTACINKGATIGTEFEAGGAITGISSYGLWSSFDSPLCVGLGGTCSYLDFLDLLSNTLTGDLQAQLATLLELVGGYETLALLNPDVTAAIPTNDRAGITTMINAYKAQDIAMSAPTLESLTGKSLHDTLFSKAKMIENFKDNLREVDAIPQTLFTSAEVEVPALRLICLGLTLPGNCTQSEMTDATLLLLNNISAPTAEDIANQQSVALVQYVWGQCFLAGVTNLNDCLGYATSLDLPIVGNPVDAAAEGLLGAFYNTDEGSNTAAIIVNATAQCADDELDRAAIANAQAIVPGGIALSIGGLVLASLGLLAAGMNKGRMAKLTVALGGVVALVGVILLIVALLGVYSAPIYSSIAGGSGDGEGTGPEDNGQAFSTGIGLTYAFVAIGGVLVGSIVTIVGGLLLPSAGVEDVLAAKA